MVKRLCEALDRALDRAMADTDKKIAAIKTEVDTQQNTDNVVNRTKEILTEEIDQANDAR